MLFANAEGMMCYLSRKYAKKQDPQYIVKNITSERCMTARSKDKQLKYYIIDGTLLFKLVFFQNFDFFKATPYLCICKECKANYVLCTLFKAYYHKT